MNRSDIAGGNLCAVILDDGSDCGNQVHPAAPLNLCTPHLAEAVAWYNANDERVRPREFCNVCGEIEARVESSGSYCGRCGNMTPGFTGKARLTPAEEDETNPGLFLAARPRTVSVVYYVQFSDRIKIGTSQNPRQRLEAIPYDRILAFEHGGYRVEAERHIQFRQHRIGDTEWFTIAPDLLDHIGRLHPGIAPWDYYRKLLATRHAVKPA